MVMTRGRAKGSCEWPRGGAMEDRGRSRRPLLYSDNNLDMMAMQSSRARLICHLVGRQEDSQPREFSSYFHGPNRNTEPPCSITSHAVRSPIPKRRPVIPTYPSLIHALRFNAKVKGVPSEECSKTESANIKTIACNCTNCNEKHCPFKAPSSCTLKPIYRDNIMTFCDQYTMTPKLNDACCGVVSKLSHNTAAVSDNRGRYSNTIAVPSEIAVRDTQGKMEFHQMHTQRTQYGPIPILKKQEYDEISYGECFYGKRQLSVEVNDASVRDRDEDVFPEAPVKSKSVFNYKKKDSCNNAFPRKILYNEGISDVITNQYPIPDPIPSPVCLSAHSSRASVVSKCITEDDKNPYSHKNISKYHMDCKKSLSRQYMVDSDREEVCQLIANPNLVRRCTPKYVKRCRSPPIKLPRRVLTSERDIETYIDKTRTKMASSNVRRKRAHDY